MGLAFRWDAKPTHLLTYDSHGNSDDGWAGRLGWLDGWSGLVGCAGYGSMGVVAWLVWV